MDTWANGEQPLVALDAWSQPLVDTLVRIIRSMWDTDITLDQSDNDLLVRIVARR